MADGYQPLAVRPAPKAECHFRLYTTNRINSLSAFPIPHSEHPIPYTIPLSRAPKAERRGLHSTPCTTP